jgi:hypothetical protein
MNTSTPTSPPATGRFDWLMVGASIWLVAGLYLDGWAHHHLESSLETFFTPWHAVFYSGFLAIAGVLLAPILRRNAGGLPWYRRVPPGYAAAALGLPLFLAGGIGDGIWHTLFGVEVDVEALLSPTHLLLALGMGMLVSGPYRAARLRPSHPTRRRWGAALPRLISLALTLSLATFFTQFVHPLTEPWTIMPGLKYPQVPLAVRQELGAASILVSAALLMGSLLLLLRDEQPIPPGGITFLIGLNALAMSVFQDQYYLLPGLVLAGGAADLLVIWLRPSARRLRAVRIVAIAIPLLYYGSYFATVIARDQLDWSIHLWGGALVLAGLVG